MCVHYLTPAWIINTLVYIFRPVDPSLPYPTLSLFIPHEAGKGLAQRRVIDLAPPTIGSVHFIHLRLLEIQRRGKVQTGISVLGVLPPFWAGKTKQCLFMKYLTKGNSFSHKCLMATPTQRMQLRYMHAQLPLGLVHCHKASHSGLLPGKVSWQPVCFDLQVLMRFIICLAASLL